MEIERQNPHWEKDFVYPYEKKRFIFEKLSKSVQEGLITAIYGLRRVGKSVCMKQLINEAISKNTKRENILYFSFDEADDDFWEVIHHYEKKLGTRVSAGHYILLDEIQKVPDWKGKIKRLYDASSARIIISGSNSSKLRTGSESLAGRLNEFVLSELSFKEFLSFQNRSDLYDGKLDESLEIAFWEYVKKPFPELVFKADLNPTDYVETISRKVIFEDLPSIFPIHEPQLLNKLFSLIVTNPGMRIEYNAIASDLGRDRKTISTYLDVLHYGFIIRRILNYSKNQLTSEKRLKRFYPSLAAFCKSDTTKIAETMVSQILKSKFFWEYRNHYEVDFILTEPLTGFEVKYSNTLSSDDWKGLKHFVLAYPDAKQVLVSKSASQKVNVVPIFRLEQYLDSKQIVISKEPE